MENPTTLEFDYDEQHKPEDLDNNPPEENHGALEDELSVTASSSHDYEGALPDAEGSPDGIFWGMLAAFCFLAGLSIGLVLYFKSSFALTVADWLRRCCPKLSQGTAQDPVLMTVVDRNSKSSVENDGAEDEKEQNSEDSSSDDEKESKSGEDSTKVKFKAGEGECDCEGASADRGEEAEGEQGGGEATAGENKENEDANDGKEATEARGDDKKSNSSSSSSSENEDKDDEKASVRHRKKAATEATEGEAAPESEDKGDGEHNE